MSYITEVYNKPLKSSKSYRGVKTLDEQIINHDKTNEILKNYFNNEYFLESQAIRNSFGKMVSTRNQTNPRYSFGKEERFSNSLNKNTLSYIKQLEEKNLLNFDNLSNNNTNLNFDKNLSKSLEIKNISNRPKNVNKFNSYNNKIQTDFLYCPANPALYKFAKPPKWSFSKGDRDNKSRNNKYDYYERPYNSQSEENNKNKKWDNRIIGGDIGVDERFMNNKNFLKEATKPGPGVYNPNYNYYKYKQYNYGYMGIKTDDNNKKNQNKDDEDQGKYYNVGCQIGSDINNYKFSNSPRFIFGTSDRDINKKRGFKVNESYLKYSSFGEQIMAQKDTRPIYSFGKQDRFNKNK